MQTIIPAAAADCAAAPAGTKPGVFTLPIPADFTDTEVERFAELVREASDRWLTAHGHSAGTKVTVVTDSLGGGGGFTACPARP